MPQLMGPSPDTLVKTLIIGHSGSGKTGALASLAKAGYTLRILDMDNKIAGGILPRLLTPEERSRVGYVSLRDKFKATPGGMMPVGIPSAFVNAMKMLDKWEDGTIPAEWGPKTVFVLDSFTFFAGAGYDWAKAMSPNAKEPRTWYWTAQQQAEDALSLLTAETFNTNVIVTSHVTYIDLQEGVKKGFPSGIGKALSPKIPTYFEHLGVIDRKEISFVPSALIDAKTPLLELAKSLPRASGLATFFESARK